MSCLGGKHLPLSSDEVLLEIHNIVSAIIYLEKHGNEKDFEKAIDKVVVLIKNENIIDVRMFANWFSKMFHESVSSEDIEKINKAKEVKSMLSLLAEQIKQKGLEQGLEQGILKNKKENAKNMLLKGFSLTDISEITGLSEKQICKLDKKGY